MVISYYGLQYIKLQYGDLSIAINPIAKDMSYPSARFGADIVLSSMNHAHFNGVEQVAHGDKKPFVINGPGEYEVGGIFIKGYSITSKYEDEERINTLYCLTVDGIDICFAGAVSSSTVPEDVVEALSNVDILFVPIGKGALTPNTAHAFSLQFKPKIIIPVHYGIPGAKDKNQKDVLKKFLDEAGSDDVTPLEKYTIKKRDLEEKKSDIVILKHP